MLPNDRIFAISRERGERHFSEAIVLMFEKYDFK